MKKIFSKTHLVIITLVFSAGLLYSQQSVDLPKAQLEQKGFYFRAGAAPAFGNTEIDGLDNLSSFQSYGLFFNLRPGFRFSNNFGAHALISGSRMLVKQNNIDINLEDYIIASVGGGLMLFFGQGYSYFMPEVMATEVTALINNTSYSSEMGLGVNLSAGHDIILGKNFGLGIMMFIHFSTVKHEFLSVTVPGDISNFYWGTDLSLRFGK